MFSFITNFFSSITTMLMLAALGAMFGLGCALVGRLNYMAAAAAGAILLVGVNASGVLGNMASNAAKQEIADLKAQKEQLALDLKREKAINEFSEAAIAELNQTVVERETKYQKVLGVIEKHKDDATCISGDELKAIGEME